MTTRLSTFSAPAELLSEIDRVAAEYNTIAGVSTTRSSYIRSVLEQRVRQEPEILRRMQAAAATTHSLLHPSRLNDAA